MKLEEYRALVDGRLAHAKRLLDDGASQTEAARTAGVSPRKLRALFPDQKWTAEYASAVGAEVRRTNRELERLGFSRLGEGDWRDGAQAATDPVHRGGGWRGRAEDYEHGEG